MPHERTRYLSPGIRKALKFSPIVGILGQRQTGKTTLLQSIVHDSYLSMDDLAQRRAAQESPNAFVVRKGLFGFDECQLVPEIFPALKLHVQRHNGPGQFILTGSIRFTSRKLIRESLTGRIFNLQLLPMTLSEGHEVPLGNVFELFARPEKIGSSPRFAWKDVNHYLDAGGLPGICFHRDREIRIGKWNAHLETLLERDLRLVMETNLPYLTLRRALEIIADSQGEPANFSEWSRKMRISNPTLKKLLLAFEALFLIRRVSPIGDRKRELFFIEDQGMATYLSSRRDPLQDKTRALFAELNAQALYRAPAESRLSSYETRGGARVPLVLSKEKSRIGFIPILGESVDHRSILSARSFLKRFPGARVIILTDAKETVSLDTQILAIPFSSLYGA